MGIRLYDIEVIHVIRNVKQVKKQKLILGLTTFITTLFALMMSLIFETDRVYTHLFYIPITMAVIWFPQRTVWFGVGFASLHIALEVFINSGYEVTAIFRAVIIVAISYMLREIWKRESKYQEQIKILSYKSSHDPLTHLYNREYFELIMKKEMRWPVTLMMADIDGLKSINDQYGHAEGDQHIIAASNILHNSLRLGDTLARIGGDEFAIIAQACGEEGALDILMRIEAQLSLYNEKAKTENWVSISVGYEVNEGEQNINDTLISADKIMYENKRKKYENINLDSEKGCSYMQSSI